MHFLPARPPARLLMYFGLACSRSHVCIPVATYPTPCVDLNLGLDYSYSITGACGRLGLNIVSVNNASRGQVATR